jgi:glycosyltransferase involved in cell wall biosynthesis
MRKIKILFAINCMNIGGAPSVVFNQIKYLDREKFEPHLLTLYPSKPANFLAQIDFLPKEHQHHFRLRRRSAFDFPTLFRIFMTLRHERFDIVYTHLFLANFLVRSLAILARVPTIVAFEHSTYFNKSGWQIAMDRLLSRFTNIILTSTKEVADFTARMEGIPREKFRVVRNPASIPERKNVDLKALRERAGLREGDKPIFLTVGRFSDEKGQRVLIEALTKIKSKLGGARFLLVGHGPKEHELDDLLDHHQLREHVRIIHDPVRAREYYHIAEWFILPSLREGQAIVVEEALLAGLPVIASRLEGMGDIIHDKENGFLFPRGDVDALAETIVHVIEHGNERKRFIASIQRTVGEILSPSARVREFERIILEQL